MELDLNNSTLPIFIENPDGSLVQGVAPDYKEATPCSTPRAQVADIDGSVNAEVAKALAKYEAFFLALVAVQLIMACTFEPLHIQYRDEAILELTLVNPDMPEPVLRTLYWVGICSECIYAGALIVVGAMAAFLWKPKLYQRFASLALLGIFAQFPLAFLNRFNLLTFFLRFICYAYARFQWNLLQGIGLLSTYLLV